jgi:pimeloyl-ACP methyl ester carboxylesterase
LVKAIVRPPRADYHIAELGPTQFEYGGQTFVREDSTLTNPRGLTLQCSMWRRETVAEPVPCVVYTHGNASCRAEALQILAPVLASGACVFAFDFAGCGMSEGEYISLGWHEKDDLQAALTHLRGTGQVGAIMLWGRSMGASSAVLQASRDYSLAGLILDSPFASLEQVRLDLTRLGLA